MERDERDSELAADEPKGRAKMAAANALAPQTAFQISVNVTDNFQAYSKFAPNLTSFSILHKSSFAVQHQYSKYLHLWVYTRLQLNTQLLHHILQ